MNIEYIGILATLFIIISMTCETKSYKSTVIMRLTNLIGSVIFVVYGCLLPAYSTALMNGMLILINTYYLIKVILEHKKQIKNMV